MSVDSHLLNTGFKNIRNDRGEAGGFQLQILSPYYRGVYLSLLEGFDVTVNGTHFPTEDIRTTVAAGTFSAAELAAAHDKRWQWFEPATLLIVKPGGLAPGLHQVQVTVKIRISYMPTRPTLFHLSGALPLVE